MHLEIGVAHPADAHQTLDRHQGHGEVDATLALPELGMGEEEPSQRMVQKRGNLTPTDILTGALDGNPDQVPEPAVQLGGGKPIASG